MAASLVNSQPYAHCTKLHTRLPQNLHIATWWAQPTSRVARKGTRHEGKAYTERTSHDVHHNDDFPVKHETRDSIHNVAKKGQERELDRKNGGPDKCLVGSVQKLISVDLSVEIGSSRRRRTRSTLASTREFLKKIQWADCSVEDWDRRS